VIGGRRLAAWLLLVAALGLAALGQYYFFSHREYLWDGVVLHGLAVACFLWAWRLSHPTAPRAARRRPSHLGTWLRKRPIPAGLLGLGLLLSLIATLLAQNRALDQATGDVAVLWALGVGAVLAAALWPTGSPPLRLREIRREIWLEAASVAGLAVLALSLRVAALGDVPYTLGGDEAWHGLLAQQVLRGQLRNPFSMGFMSMPTFFYWPLSWSLRLAGDTITGLRLPAALVGAATVPVLYLFARNLWGRRIAFLSAAFLATYDFHIHYSRLGANNIWDPLFVLLALWALERGLSAQDEVKQGKRLLLAGLVMGLSVYFYTGARLLPLLTVAYLAFLGLRNCLAKVPDQLDADPTDRPTGQGQRHPAPPWQLLLLVILAFLVASGPMLGYALSHPNEWNARINQVGIIQSGWLAREPGLTGKSTLQILTEQFLRAAGAFHVFPDRTAWYGSDRPLLGPLAGIFAVLGMAWALAHWRDRRTYLVLIWFWSVIITGGMLTESPPSSQRLVIAIPAVALIVAFGLEQSVRLACRILAFDRKWENAVLGLLILVLMVSSVHYYFIQFTPTRRYGSENGETATMIGRALQDLDGDYRAYLFGAPRIYWGFGTMTFLAPDVPGQDVVEPLDAPPDFVEKGHGAVFIFLPERVGELEWVRQAFPDGVLREFRDATGTLRFTIYQVRQPTVGKKQTWQVAENLPGPALIRSKPYSSASGSSSSVPSGASASPASAPTSSSSSSGPSLSPASAP
jgi:hypothetical protein